MFIFFINYISIVKIQKTEIEPNECNKDDELNKCYLRIAFTANIIKFKFT
jgi:hypothetical protein